MKREKERELLPPPPNPIKIRHRKKSALFRERDKLKTSAVTWERRGEERERDAAITIK